MGVGSRPASGANYFQKSSAVTRLEPGRLAPPSSYKRPSSFRGDMAKTLPIVIPAAMHRSKLAAIFAALACACAADPVPSPSNGASPISSAAAPAPAPPGCPDNRTCHIRAESKKSAADGSCDDCGAHCAYGSEEACVKTCKDRCDEEKDANRHPGHTDSSISDYCAGNSWSACLAKCGGVRGCRNSWCDGDHPERDACHTKADRDLQSDLRACDISCPISSPLPQVPRPNCTLDAKDCSGKSCSISCRVVPHCDCDTGLLGPQPHCWCDPAE